MTNAGYWDSPWPGEDGGPLRLQTSPTVNGPRFVAGEVSVTSREAVAATMLVLRDPGEVFVLRHTVGPDSSGWVERVHAETLETEARSPELVGGPNWPGGLAAHRNGSLYVVFGEHAHRLSANLEIEATVSLPRHRPYNSFVILPDGCLATKDFGGLLPGHDRQSFDPVPTELLILDPEDLRIRARFELPEPSIARLSADANDIYVVGTSSLYRVNWNGESLALDETFTPRYRTIDGQTYGWDSVLALGAVWFLDNGEGAERYVGTFRDQGINVAPLHLVRIDLETQAVSLTEICGLPNSVIANPPLIDQQRRIAVGYDSGNGVMTAFDIAADGSLNLRWTRQQNHAAHMLLFADSGELVTTDHHRENMADEIVVLDIESGDERLRVNAASPLQSVLFPAVGWNNDFYYCSLPTVTRVAGRSLDAG